MTMSTIENYSIQTDNSTIKVNSSGQIYVASVPPVDIAVTAPITNTGNTLGLAFDNATLILNGSNQLVLNLNNANTWTASQSFSANNIYNAGWNVRFADRSAASNTACFSGFKSGASGVNWNMQCFTTYVGPSGNDNFGFVYYNDTTNTTVLTLNGDTNAVTSVNNTFDDGSGNTIRAGYNKTNLTQTTLTGTTAGSIVWSQPEQGSAYKKFIGYANGYENTTATAQTITYPTAFTNTPIISSNSTGMTLSTSTSALTLPASMSATATGWIIIEGY